MLFTFHALIVVSSLLFYHYGKSGRKFYRYAGYVSVFLLCFTYGHQNYYFTKALEREKQLATATLKYDENLRKLTATVHEYLQMVKSSQKWDDVASSTSLQEYTFTVGGVDKETIVATEPLIEVGGKN
jgi:poly-beta-hydroxyalkanoate depolymerase